jgi:hypothetical protein
MKDTPIVIYGLVTVAKPYQQIEAKNKKLIAMRNHYESKFEV